MYFRVKKSPSGRVLQLLESYRNFEGKPRQIVVASLGDAMIPEEMRHPIAKAVEMHLYGHQEIVPVVEDKQSIEWVNRIVKQVEREGRWKPARQISRNQKLTTSPEETSLDVRRDEEVINGVLVDRIGHTHTTSLGPELLGLTVWNTLEMPELLKSLGFNPAQIKAATVSVVNRLVDPVSENYLIPWLQSSSLPDLLGEEIARGKPARYYRISDKLLKNRESIEAHLRKIEARHFSLSRTILLFDLTNTHFEGRCHENPKAERGGNNKQKRNDCCQVVVGMVFDEHGFELAHTTFPGKTNDSTTLVRIVNHLKQITESDGSLDSTVKPLVIVDAGVATKSNLKLLRKEGFGYLVNDSRRKRKTYQDEFEKEKEFKKIFGRDPSQEVKVKFLEVVVDDCESDNENDKEEQPFSTDAEDAEDAEKSEDTTKEYLVLCKSNGRRDKELAIISQAEKRFLDQLKNLASRIDKGNLVDPLKINRCIGRIQEKNPRVAHYYEVKLVEDNPTTPDNETRGDSSSLPAKTTSEGKKSNTITPANEENSKTGMAKKLEETQQSPKIIQRLHWKRHDEKFNENEKLLGCYVLRTDQNTMSAEELWKLYMVLTNAEDGFRSLKSDLGLRPNRHRIEDRVDAHIFISVLAYHLLQFILYTLKLAGDDRSWFTINRILQTHCYTTILMPTIDKKLYRMRKAGEPEECQRDIYHLLGVNVRNLPCTKIITTMP